MSAETDIQFEVWQDGHMVASADSLSDAQHFMVIYGQDGPVEAKTAVTTRTPGFNVRTPAPEGEACPHDAYETDAAGQPVRCVDCGMAIASLASPVVPAPEGEAVAWRWRRVGVVRWSLWDLDPRVDTPAYADAAEWEVQPLYASPVVPVGVSKEEIAKALFDRHWSAVSASPKWPGEDDDDGSYWLWLADAILAALRPTDTGRE